MPSGGILPIALAGEEDIHVSGNPDFSTFRSVVRRAISFGMEPVVLPFDSQADFGLTAKLTIPTTGHMLGKLQLRVELPALGDSLSYTNSIGHALIEEISLEIDDQIIDRHNGEFMEWWTQQNTPSSKLGALNYLIGRVNPADFNDDFTAAQTLFIPLQFWFCRHDGHQLPILALQSSQIRINVKFRSLAEMYATTTSRATSVAISTGKHFARADIIAETYYVDPRIARVIASPSHKQILIENVQVSVPYSIPAGKTTVTEKLRFKHPVKELLWALRYEENSLQNEWFRQTNIEVGESGTDTDMVDTVELRVDNDRLFDAFPARQFRVLQPMNHHTRVPMGTEQWYAFSWAQQPEDINPSGTLNLSRANDFTIELGLKDSTVIANDKTLVFSSQALGYNLLEIKDGAGKLKQLY